jgi:1-deoxy-D-xylulose-5-phosphate reductoisomerase
MRTPIAQALAQPSRIDAGVTPLDLARLGQLTFEAPDHARFPCVRLAYDALRAGAYACVALNAANEVAVAAFLAGRARFTAIAEAARQVLETTTAIAIGTLDDALECDARARRSACRMLGLPADPGILSLAA